MAIYQDLVNIQTITFTPTGDVTGTTSGSTSLNPVLSLGTITQGIGTNFSKINIDSKGRITGNTSVGNSDINSALGYTPYNSANPTGYITSVSLIGYLPIAGSFLQAGTATTTFTVNIGTTMSNITYKVNISATSMLAAASNFITNKTTISFDVTYLTAITGSVSFDYSIFR